MSGISAAVAVVVLAALAGWLLAGLSPRGGGDRARVDAPLVAATADGAVRIETAPGWRLTGKAVPAGLGFADGTVLHIEPWPGADTSLAVGMAPLRTASLLAAPVGDHVEPGSGSVKRIAGRPALAYRGVAVGGGRQIADIYAAPTTSGVLTVACLRPASLPADGEICRDGLTRIDAPGAARLPVEDAAFYARLGGVIDRLRTRRLSARQQLAAARSAEAQRAAASRTASAYGEAARSLAEVAVPASASAQTAFRLALLESAYRRVAAAARAGRPARFLDALRSAAAGERAFEGYLGLLQARLRAAALEAPR